MHYGWSMLEGCSGAAILGLRQKDARDRDEA
jgi:hypothetical protein